MRLLVLPIVLSVLLLATALVILIVTFGYTHGGIASGLLLIGISVLPFVAVGQLVLLITANIIRKTEWSVTSKAGLLVCAATIIGSLLTAWFSWELGAVAGVVSGACWLALNHDYLSFPSPA
jgi:hypothetical protein